MITRVNKNYDRKNDKECFGIAIKLDEGFFYCKYPIGLQRFYTRKEALYVQEQLREAFRNGATLKYSVNGSRGVNKPEYVAIVTNNSNQIKCELF